jgi:hypothetical protein
LGVLSNDHPILGSDTHCKLKLLLLLVLFNFFWGWQHFS